MEKIDTMGMDSPSEAEVLYDNPSDWVRHQRIIFDIEQELKAQDAKWGTNRRKPMAEWVVILGEEFGEVCNAIMEDETWEADEHTYEEIVQVVSVGIQMLKDVRITVSDRKISRYMKDVYNA